jgi:metal-responsive CopG/Arc/MetJ family transcriptional regulator
MGTKTVNISFKDDLLAMIDELAIREDRSRSELVREAARMYIERKRRWEHIFAYGRAMAERNELTESDVNMEINAYRIEKNKG